MSGLEDLLALHIRQTGLPIPVRELVAVPGRRFRWDFAWPDHRLLVEVQGGTWAKGAHSTGKGIQRDIEKLNIATLHDWHIFQFTGDDIRKGIAMVTLQKWFNTHHATEKPE